MVPITIDDRVQVPTDLNSLEAFRRWARSDQFPQHGHFAFLGHEVWVDLSMEQAFSHNQVKTRITSVLDELIVRGGLGYFFSDRMLLSNLEVELSTEPDGMFVSYGALERGDIRLIEGAEGGCVELVGTPDMTLEVVSRTSARKDTKVLRQLYWEAGVAEYWLVDARGPEPRFDLLRRGGRGYAAARRRGGWARSGVFGRSFRLSQRPDPLGNPSYTLDVRP